MALTEDGGNMVMPMTRMELQNTINRLESK